jgi:hypothetical protein
VQQSGVWDDVDAGLVRGYVVSAALASCLCVTEELLQCRVEYERQQGTNL